MRAAVKRRTRSELRNGVFVDVAGYAVTQAPGVSIWCKTRECADYVAGLLFEHGWHGAFTRINRALGAEGDPLTRFPPGGAGDVIGAAP